MDFDVLWSVWPVKSFQVSIKSCPNIILLEKWKFLQPFQKLLKNVGKIIIATGFEKLPKVQ